MKKKYIILISVIIIYFLVLFLFVGIDEIKKEQRDATILIDENTVWKLEGKTWRNIASEVERNELDWQEFTVFVNYENIGKHYLWHNEKWYLFDENKKPFIYEDGNFFAIRANYEVNLLKINSQKVSDRTYINKVLSENGITGSQEFTVNTLYKIDFDSDGITENFYAISNAFARETAPKKVFSIVFMEKAGQIYYLYNSIDDNDGQNGCKPYINTAVDLTEDKVYEIAISCGYYSMQSRHDMLYTYEDNEFKLVLSNQ